MTQKEQSVMDAATVLLMNHYDLETAKYKAMKLFERTNGSPIDVMVLSCTMALESEPWWDALDAKTRATQQLTINTLLLDSIEKLIQDVEEALGRPLEGADLQEKADRLAQSVPRILAELRGEPFTDPLQIFLEKLRSGDMEGMLDSLMDEHDPSDDLPPMADERDEDTLSEEETDKLLLETSLHAVCGDEEDA